MIFSSIDFDEIIKQFIKLNYLLLNQFQNSKCLTVIIDSVNFIRFSRDKFKAVMKTIKIKISKLFNKIYYTTRPRSIYNINVFEKQLRGHP